MLFKEKQYNKFTHEESGLDGWKIIAAAGTAVARTATAYIRSIAIQIYRKKFTLRLVQPHGTKISKFAI